jgi:hypothetical protein
MPDLAPGPALLRDLRHTIYRLRPRRIELGPTDTAIMRDEMQRRNDMLDRERARSLWLDMNEFRFADPETAKSMVLMRVPVLLGCPETRFIQWDDYEQMLVLSATCFTPDPKKSA